jgi:hypothetical protein
MCGFRIHKLAKWIDWWPGPVVRVQQPERKMKWFTFNGESDRCLTTTAPNSTAAVF